MKEAKHAWFQAIGLMRLSQSKAGKATSRRAFPSGRWRSRAESVLGDINKTLAGYTRAQLFSCILIGFICTLAFYILGLNYALLLGILAAIFEFIPLIGPLTLAVIATLVAGITGSPWTAAYVAIFLIVLRILQDYVFGCH